MPRRITDNDNNISKPIANLRKDSGDDLTNPRCPRATPTTKGNKNKERYVPVTRLKEDYCFGKGPEKDYENFLQKYLKVSMNQESQDF